MNPINERISQGIEKYQIAIHGEANGVSNVNEGHLSEQVKGLVDSGHLRDALITYGRGCLDIVASASPKDASKVVNAARTAVVAGLGLKAVHHTVKTNESYTPTLTKSLIAAQGILGLAVVTSVQQSWSGSADELWEGTGEGEGDATNDSDTGQSGGSGGHS